MSADPNGFVSFRAVARPRGGVVLRSPVSGAPCVYWRVRVVEEIDARLHLVHEIASPEGFDLAWAVGGDRRVVAGSAAEPGGDPVDTSAGVAGPDPLNVAVQPDSARVHATPVLHRPGSPGAQAAAQAFGFAGRVSVEEVVVRPGDELGAQGVLEASDAASPFRQVGRPLELFEATLSLPTRSSLGPVLLPWALGTAAALLGAVGAAAWIAWRYLPHPAQDEAPTPLVVPPGEIGPLPARLPRFP